MNAKLIHKLAKLRGRSLHEVGVRGAQFAAAWRERTGLSPDARSLGSRALARRLAPGVSADAASLAARWAARDGHAAPRFFAGADDPAATAAELRRRWPLRADAIVRTADAALRGELDVLGHTALSYGNPIDWHADPVAGLRAPLAHWSRVPYLDASVVGDHKVVWEVNRHQFLVTLAQAWLLTGRDAYARGAVDTIERWTDANPPKRGVNWASSLEVGFRAMSWLWALSLVRQSAALRPDAFRRALGTLYLHARHLETYLSTYFSPNTHLTGEALALFHLGVLLPELGAARRWRDVGLRVLLQQLPRQIHRDGVYFEQATYYQKYTADFYLHAFSLADRNGIAVPDEARATVARVVEHLRAVARPDGLLPLFGDDDGGRLAWLSGDDGRDARGTLAVAALLFGRGDFAASAAGHAEEALWLFGVGAPGRVERLAELPDESPRSAAFPVGGYFVARGARREGDYLAIDCGPHGTRNAGHAHADALSFELAVGGRPVVVDAGTFTYSAAERDEFRGGAGHNAPLVDGQSSSEPFVGRAFAWRSQAVARARGWDASGPVAYFRGEHDGFLRLSDPVSCERTVLAGDGWWLVRDRLRARGAHRIEIPLHLAPGLTAHGAGANLLDVRGPAGPLVRVAAFAAPGSSPVLDVGDGWVSSGYGSRERSVVARVAVDATAGCDVVTLFAAPAADGTPARLGAGVTYGGWQLSVERGQGTDVIVLDGEAFGLTTAGGVAWVRRASDATVSEFALFGAGRVVAAGVSTGDGDCAFGTPGGPVVRRALTFQGSSDVRH